MKSLYKKIGVGLLSAAVVAGGIGFSKGSIAFAQNNDNKKQVLRRLELRDYNEVMGLQELFGYKVGPVSIDSISSECEQKFVSVYEFIFKLEEVKKKYNDGRSHLFAIAGDSYMISF